MKCAVLALSLLPAAVSAQATQLESQPERGTGRLAIQFSGAEFALSLAVPSADIVGFERPAASDEDRALVAVAISDLSKPLELFVLPEEAGCFTASANVALTSDAQGEPTQAIGAETSPSETPELSEFQADYVIQCQSIEALNTIEFAYFDRFEATQKFQVSVERSDGLHTFDVTRATPLVDLSGL